MGKDNGNNPQPRAEAEGSHRTRAVGVLGLGKFGSAVALELEMLGIEVLGVDHDPEVVQRFANQLSTVVRADVTDEEVLTQIGIPEMDQAVVASGEHLEVSILAAAACLNFGIADIWAKAVTPAHGRILSRLGINHVIYPEPLVGKRIAHRISGSLLDFTVLDDGYATFTVAAPSEMIGRTIGESDFERRFKLVVVAVKTPEGDWQTATPDYFVQSTDQVMVIGQQPDAERYRAR